MTNHDKIIRYNVEHKIGYEISGKTIKVKKWVGMSANHEFLGTDTEDACRQAVEWLQKSECYLDNEEKAKQ